MSNIVPIKGLREAPKSQQSKMETSIITVDQVSAWHLPPFQRTLRVNDKVRAGAEELKGSCVINGVITLGKIKSDARIWIVDGQHRIEMFKISGLQEAIADIRLCQFDSFAEMAHEFTLLNSSIVRMRPDDILRGLESNQPALRQIRKSCEFVGYDNIRRSGTHSPMVGMSATLRSWAASCGDTPNSSGGGSAAVLAETLTHESAEDLIRFLLTAYAAWGRDVEYHRLWGNLNVTICMWLWRKLVMDRDRGVKRYALLDIAMFKKCLMSLSAAADYVDWLQGRHLSDRDRAPCYARVKEVFVKRLAEETNAQKKPMLPSPAWAHAK